MFLYILTSFVLGLRICIQPQRRIVSNMSKESIFFLQTLLEFCFVKLVVVFARTYPVFLRDTLGFRFILG